MRRIQLDLFVSGIDAGLIGNHPHLHEVHRRFVSFADTVTPRIVFLRMQDASPGTHSLRETGIDDTAVSDRVLVDQRSIEHPRDDLHVAMGMSVETRAGRHRVVVVHQQHPVMGVVRIPVIAERE